MSIVTTPPTLSYVSSQDVSDTPSGTTNYMILFDASNTLLSNIIMFEYKFQDISQGIPNLSNTTFGFVAIENAIQSGINNQYIISVPVDSQTTNGVPMETIQVRVYYGDKSSSDVIVSEWSNELDVYLPPKTPEIFTNNFFDGSYYDPSINSLFVLFNESVNDFSYNKIKFVVCFFYQDITNTTLWKVSEPTTALETVLGTSPFRYVQVPLEGTVSTNPLYNNVYVSVHAVYDWSVGGTLYHSISNVSNEVSAVAASDDKIPDITSVVYNVYNGPLEVPGDQTMTISWSAPGNSPLPAFAIDHYELYYSINGNSFLLYPGAGNLPSTPLSYIVDVGATGLNLNCGDSIVFRINAVDAQTTNTPSAPSASTEIFKYSQAVTDLLITDTTYDPSSGHVGLTVKFNGVSDSGNPNKGCGTGLQYIVKINGFPGYSHTGSLIYDSGEFYSVSYSGLSITQFGTVEVWLQTQNTNSGPSIIDGLSTSIPFFANVLVLNPVDYQVYQTQDNNNQNMSLSWSNPGISGSNWSITDYVVEYSTDNGSNWFESTTTSANSYVFDASPLVALSSDTININFRVKANLQNGSVQYTITSNQVNQYTFKYAEAVTDLTITNTSYDSVNNKVGLTVNFNGVSNSASPNKGLGAGLQYVIKIDGTIYTSTSGSNLTYVSGNSYSVVYSNLPVSQVGNVEVYLQTLNTNSLPQTTLNGASTSVVYIANNLVLDPVVYQVYQTLDNADQNMTLSWSNPTISGSDWLVNEYVVQYSTDNGSSWTNATTTNVNSYIFDATSEASLSSTVNILFKVIAKMVNGLIQYDIISNEVNQYTFTFAEAVTNLMITNTSYDALNNLVGLTVNFTGVSDSGSPNKGLGTGLQYVVKINDTSYNYVSGSSLNYVSNNLYSVTYSNLNISQIGTVEVYLVTGNTNSYPPSTLDGASASVPYIANNLILNAIDYQVYNSGSNNSQNITLTWSISSLLGWSVTNYTVRFSTDNGNSWTNAVNTNDTIYTFNASSYAVSNPENLLFEVLSNMANGPNSYVITSNQQSIYTFKYAETPQSPIVHWSIANTSNNTMDINYKFKNPLTNGVNNGLENFVVTVLDNAGTIVSFETVNYVAGGNFYNVNFNNINYALSGVITVEAFVKDPNNNDNLTTSDVYKSSIGYQTSTVPLFKNIAVSGGNITGNIITFDQLKPVGYVLVSGNPPSHITYSTIAPYTSGFTLNSVTESNGELNYSFTINILNFFGTTPSGIVITAANDAGVGTGTTTI